MSFKKYYQENYLKESPMRLGLSYPDILDNDALNQEQALEIISQQQKVQDINLHNIELSVYKDKTDNKIFDSFINKTPLIKCTYIYTEKDNDMHLLGVWNHKMSRGLAFLLFFDYYLPKCKSITSDTKHTTQGERFWKRIIERSEEGRHTIKGVVQGEEIDLDDVDKFWGNTPKFYDYQIRVYSK
jgi:hypothetical protein